MLKFSMKYVILKHYLSGILPYVMGLNCNLIAHLLHASINSNKNSVLFTNIYIQTRFIEKNLCN